MQQDQAYSMNIHLVADLLLHVPYSWNLVSWNSPLARNLYAPDIAQVILYTPISILNISDSL